MRRVNIKLNFPEITKEEVEEFARDYPEHTRSQLNFLKGNFKSKKIKKKKKKKPTMMEVINPFIPKILAMVDANYKRKYIAASFGITTG